MDTGKEIIGTDFTEEEKASFQTARIGTYFILPLRTTVTPVSSFRLTEMQKKLTEAQWQPYEWKYDDLYNRINELFCGQDPGQAGCIGLSYQLSLEEALKHFGKPLADNTRFFVYNKKGEGKNAGFLPPKNLDASHLFRFRCVQIMIMHSGIGFLIIGIEANNPLVAENLKNSGHNDNRYMIGPVVTDEKNPDRIRSTGDMLDFGAFIASFLGKLCMTDFSGSVENGSTNHLFLDTTVYSTAVLRKRMQGSSLSEMTEKIKALCLNIREGQEFGTPTFCRIDARSYMMLAAPSLARDGRQWLRWGIYTTFEHNVQVIFDEPSPKAEEEGEYQDLQEPKEIDPINVCSDNREDNYLPFLILALYSRYSYLFFSEILGKTENSNAADMSWLETQMFRLKASGTFFPGDMTPYDNENEFLRHQHTLYDIRDSQELIDSKIGIISHQRELKAEVRNRYLESFLAFFGLASILCDSIGVFDSVVSPELRLPHALVCIAELLGFGGFILTLFLRDRRKK